MLSPPGLAFHSNATKEVNSHARARVVGLGSRQLGSPPTRPRWRRCNPGPLRRTEVGWSPLAVSGTVNTRNAPSGSTRTRLTLRMVIGDRFRVAAHGDGPEEGGVVRRRRKVEGPFELERPKRVAVFIVWRDADPLAARKAEGVSRSEARPREVRVERQGGVGVQVAKQRHAQRLVARAVAYAWRAWSRFRRRWSSSSRAYTAWRARPPTSPLRISSADYSLSLEQP